MKISNDLCPGCKAIALPSPIVYRNQPCISNRPCLTRAEAALSPTGDIELAFCQSCGLVFNRSYDPDLITYDEFYDNTQHHSERFSSHLGSVCSLISDVCGLSPRSRVLEIGCGKGDFLIRLCRLSGCEGHGYDTTYRGPACVNEKVYFFPKYVIPADKLPSFDLIVCRHVVEHVPGIGEFFADLYCHSVQSGGIPVFIETPDFAWIAENGAFWDICYEHCNYFSVECLRRLLESAGFQIIESHLIFGDQYQGILVIPKEAGIRDDNQVPRMAKHLVEEYCRNASARQTALNKRIEDDTNLNWIVWGAGAKGVTLANRTRVKPRAVVDINPSKQGLFLPGSAVQVISPASPEVREAELVVIANPQYGAEIEKMLETSGCSPRIIVL